jgi:hypothetical protein
VGRVQGGILARVAERVDWGAIMGKAQCFVCELLDELEDEKDGEEPDVLFARAIAHGAVIMGGRSMDLKTCRIHRAMIEDELEDTRRELRKVKRAARELGEG